MRYLLTILALVAAPPATSQTITIAPPAGWRDCAVEGGTCASPAGALVRYGAGARNAYQIVDGPVPCANYRFGDPAPNVVKACAIASPAAAVSTPKPAPTPQPVPAPTPAPAPKPSPVADARAKLGVNVAASNYFSNEPTFANQAYGIAWLSNWQGVDPATLGPDGMPLAVPREKPIQGFLMPPITAYTGGDTTTVCTWKGDGALYAQGDWSWPTAQGPGLMEFKWNHKKPPRVWLEIRYSNAADPMRDLDCRLKTTDRAAVYDPALLDYLKPFGTLRFLDWSRANSSPLVVDWKGRSTAAGVGRTGNDGVALEHMIGLANANASSPWFTIPWNADADYHRQMAKMVHASIPAGRQVYVELSNEVWNYMFWQTTLAEQEGLAAKLSENRFQAALHRYAQKITEIMPIWAEVFADRPKDLVRVMATQSGNAWTGQVIMEWNKSAVAPHIDAIAIAPYYFVDVAALTADHDTNMRLLAEAADRQIAGPVPAYRKLATKFGKRLVAYEGGQHMIDPDNEARRIQMQRDSRNQGIYTRYLNGWRAAGGDLFTLYAATGSISRYGSWGLREYAGQPLAETPKLRGVLDYAKQ